MVRLNFTSITTKARRASLKMKKYFQIFLDYRAPLPDHKKDDEWGMMSKLQHRDNNKVNQQ